MRPWPRVLSCFGSFASGNKIAILQIMALAIRLSWFKIRNREYSQMAGREELFERERHQEPVPGWHSCVLACDESEEAS